MKLPNKLPIFAFEAAFLQAADQAIHFSLQIVLVATLLATKTILRKLQHLVQNKPLDPETRAV